MLDRLINIFKSMFNKGVSKMETPEILAEQAEMELESNMKKLMEAITAGITNEKLLQQKAQKTKEEITSWEGRAAVAVKAGNDEVAKQCIQKKVDLNSLLKDLESQLSEQRNSINALKSQHSDLERKYREFKSSKDALIARAKASDNIAKANEMISGAPGSKMDQWEQKIREKEAKAEALNELRGPSEVQIKEVEKNMVVDDELAALKAAISTPKLIASPDKTVVDENLPMVIEVIDDEKK